MKAFEVAERLRKDGFSAVAKADPGMNSWMVEFEIDDSKGIDFAELARGTDAILEFSYVETVNTRGEQGRKGFIRCIGRDGVLFSEMEDPNDGTPYQ